MIAVIPARGGSKGVHKKNIRVLNGKPLIVYTIEAAINSNVDEIYVSTDDNEIADIAGNYDVNIVKRPKKLSKDNSPTLPVIQHVINKLDRLPEYVITLQPTSPFRTSIHINDASTIIRKNIKADSLVSVTRVPHNMIPESIMNINKDGYLINYLDQKSPILRRQNKPVYYARNGAAIYITRTDNLNHYVYGGIVLPYVMTFMESMDIDEEVDFILAEKIMQTITN